MVFRLGVDDLAASLDENQAPQPPSGSANCLACAGGSTLQREVAAFVGNLPAQQRVALMLRRRHQVRYAEIAATLGCTEREARKTVHEVLRALRAHLGDQV